MNLDFGIGAMKKNFIKKTLDKDDKEKEKENKKEKLNTNINTNTKLNNNISKYKNGFFNYLVNPENEKLNDIKLNYDFNEYEEKILFHYAGLCYKINEQENEEQENENEKENYFSYNWQYVLVFPNPDFNKEEKYIETINTYDLYDVFFKADESELSNLKAKNCEKKVFNFIINNKINDNLKNICLVNKGGCLRKSKIYLILFNFYLTHLN